ncbi:superoxide dismutase [Cu-Zn] SodC [Kiloniella sp. b19]|uniref:superoxide dismutase [Cu-Zn] SodC n=1 Tax=Kiloniella sp. GXU_MW_B19 TaxID=3141326 RepID=UPI0031E146EC
MQKALTFLLVKAVLGTFFLSPHSAAHPPGQDSTASSENQTIKVRMLMLSTLGNIETGTITIEETPYGILFKPVLNSITPGFHGFHLHEHGSCDPVVRDGKTILAGAAGGHYDPHNTGKHGFPWDQNSHLGDLPALFADAVGTVTDPVLAPRLSLADLRGRALIIHVGGDNHSDHPAPLGGGGARLACGVIN